MFLLLTSISCNLKDTSKMLLMKPHHTDLPDMAINQDIMSIDQPSPPPLSLEMLPMKEITMLTMPSERKLKLTMLIMPNKAALSDMNKELIMYLLSVRPIIPKLKCIIKYYIWIIAAGGVEAAIPTL
jgi:hypothetical protein